jgi:NADPH-dependent glutamate synthase beta subunit-like oxidoreductase
MAIEGRTHKPVVDRDLCQACRVCFRECPAELLSELRSDEDTVRGYVYSNTNLAENDVCPPCLGACPLGQQVRDYVQLLKAGKVKEALLVIRQDNPLPGVCGYVCHHPCERACIRGSWDDPVSIRELKRYAAQYEMDHRNEIVELLIQRKEPALGKRVVIVGAGPAGLACGFELVMRGYAVTVMDALAQPGGMLRAGIPSFRLPRHVIDHDIGIMISLGITFMNSVCIGKDIALEALCSQGADAVVVAVGAQQATSLGIPGEGGEGYMEWHSFLEQINMGKGVEIQGKVLVVGGGNVAIDVARCAVRAEARAVEVLCIEREDEMPADPSEVKRAKREGIHLRFQVVPIAVLKANGRITGLTCAPARLGWDELGRRIPMRMQGDPLTVKGDFVISATGQRSELSFLKAEAISERETIDVVKTGRIRGYNAVFGAGDAVTGPSTVVDAIASGQATARHVINYLKRSGNQR